MTPQERKVIELALEALRKARRKILTTEECHAAIMSIREALAQPDQDEVDIRSRLYQRIHELECLLKDIAEYTGEKLPTN